MQEVYQLCGNWKQTVKTCLNGRCVRVGDSREHSSAVFGFRGMRLIRPLHDNILVKQDPAKEKSDGGLFLPQGKETYDETGTVIRVGPGKMTINGVLVEVSVKVGDRIVFKRRPGSHLGESDPEWKDLLMLNDSDVIGILEPDGDTLDHTAEPNTGFTA